MNIKIKFKLLPDKLIKLIILSKSKIDKLKTIKQNLDKIKY
jgi:hypothetical protein